MPNRKTTKAALAAVAAMPPIPKDIIDQFVTGPMSAESVENNPGWRALRDRLVC